MTSVLLTSCGKCCVSKLREAAETWLRRPRKTPENWRESYYDDYNFFINWKIILTFLSSGAIFLRNKTRILEAMVVWLMLVICNCLTITSMGISGESDTQELGKEVYLRKINLLDDFQEKEASVFDSFPSTCFFKKDLHSTGSFFDYYASTKAFYWKVATEAGLDPSLQSSFTLGVTLSSAA